MSISHLTTQRNNKSQPLCYFYSDIPIQPAVVLAPMEGVTNIVFRRLMRNIGGMGLTYTIYSFTDLTENSKQFIQMARVDKDESPIAIQIYGNQPQMMAQAAEMVQDMGADIIDINMGCPSKKSVLILAVLH